jgi:hypothetical protein
MVCVTGGGAGVENVWEQEKLEARKMLENAARHEAAVPSAQCTLCWADPYITRSLLVVFPFCQNNYNGFLPIPHIQPRLYFSNI